MRSKSMQLHENIYKGGEESQSIQKKMIHVVLYIRTKEGLLYNRRGMVSGLIVVVAAAPIKRLNKLSLTRGRFCTNFDVPPGARTIGTRSTLTKGVFTTGSERDAPDSPRPHAQRQTKRTLRLCGPIRAARASATQVESLV
jgi:hypothetical protein